MSANNSTTSTEEEASTNDETTVRFEKDVLITAYAERDYNDARTFMDDVFGQFLDEGEDLWEMNTTEKEKAELSINFEVEDPQFGDMREFSESISPFNSSSRRLLKAGIESGVIDADELDWLEATTKIEKESSYQYSESLPGNRAVQSMADELDTPEEFGYEPYDGYIFDVKWTKEVEQSDADGNADEQFEVRLESCHSSDIKRRRVLTHQAERSADNRYETPADVDEEDLPWSMQVSIKIETQDEEAMDEISEEVVPHINRELAQLDGIEKTRLTDCETTKQEQGACYRF